MKEKRSPQLNRKYKLHQKAKKYGRVDSRNRAVYVSLDTEGGDVKEGFKYVSALRELSEKYGYNIQTEIKYIPNTLSLVHGTSIQQPI